MKVVILHTIEQEGDEGRYLAYNRAGRGDTPALSLQCGEMAKVVYPPLRLRLVQQSDCDCQPTSRRHCHESNVRKTSYESEPQLQVCELTRRGLCVRSASS